MLFDTITVILGLYAAKKLYDFCSSDSENEGVTPIFVGLIKISAAIQAKRDNAVEERELLSLLDNNPELVSFYASEKDKKSSIRKSVEEAASLYDEKSLRNIFTCLAIIAMADGRLSKTESKYLNTIAAEFDIDSSVLKEIETKAFDGDFLKNECNSGCNLDSYYEILEVDSSCSDTQLKSAYRNKIKGLHPDVYANNNLPPAAARAISLEYGRVEEAYGFLKEARGIK